MTAWFTTPVARTQPPRDELAIKLALAVTVPGVDVGTDDPAAADRDDVRPAGLHPAQARRSGGDPVEPSDMAWSLVLDSLVFAAEAEIRWLDHCEARLRRAAAERPHHVAGRARRHAGRRPSRPARGAHAMNAVLTLDAVTRVHGEGATEVLALRGVSFVARTPASWSP